MRAGRVAWLAKGTTLRYATRLASTHFDLNASPQLYVNRP